MSNIPVTDISQPYSEVDPGVIGPLVSGVPSSQYEINSNGQPNPRYWRLTGIQKTKMEERVEAWVTQLPGVSGATVLCCILVYWALDRNNGRPPVVPRPNISTRGGRLCNELEYEMRWAAELITKYCPDDIVIRDCDSCDTFNMKLCFIYKVVSTSKCFLCAARGCKCT
ncbi:hypothetical protein Q8F55_000651 [Vanrija albida]|uniref:Uncharacterized protein n=1 Tax=Vanrija albida TaxID=181172 RepID=A0ABR3QE16_9TREE